MFECLTLWVSCSDGHDLCRSVKTHSGFVLKLSASEFPGTSIGRIAAASRDTDSAGFAPV